jgi:hypothetical protein
MSGRASAFSLHVPASVVTSVTAAGIFNSCMACSISAQPPVPVVSGPTISQSIEENHAMRRAVGSVMAKSYL